ncbi:3-hydroxyacyl-CoA dehydrogenase [Aquibaculum arenosum]|uniref:3-hydroxyacyl-CoA dehydrogenase n=1 Tax=Aquibaculum arenosum TaxID=3032591 RepID=A0ABT5YQE5_9PROT|nr:3-hydroxyacyl-CoA dehydrogenase [Fodinicurvata sp. CAU 1616]MDF2096955.1 3-hydroxyacyl-CoA dehydrogenase [Fodinicurvata sp. CAU 1616]
MSGSTAIVGSGLIGRAWAIAFARAGWTVRLWDPVETAPAEAVDTIAGLLSDLAANDMLRGQDASRVLGRIAPAPNLAAALEGADWVQENAPEKLEIKRALWAEMEPLAGADTILASSTSAIVPSLFTEGLAGRHRCLTAHPINPPYLVPATELVPAPWTSAETMEKAESVMRAIGQAPIVMRKEIDGFVMNRMQGALLEEAFRLVADGVCGAEDVDVGIREGLALRWAFMGPFETIDLNAPGGVRDYAERYQGLYEGIFPSMQRRVDWAGPVMETIEGERRARLSETELQERQRWRDRHLMALLRHKARARDDIGE